MSNPQLHFVIFCSCIESVEASNIKYHLHFVVILYVKHVYSNVEEVETSVKCNVICILWLHTSPKQIVIVVCNGSNIHILHRAAT